MKVYLVQHGDAVAKEVDPERPLSGRGRGDVARVAAFLASAGVGAARVIHSGKTRARQTAEQLAERLAPGGEAQALEGLNPKDSGERLSDEIAAAQGDLLVAGHQPFMGRFAARLLTGSEEGMSVDYRPGTVVCLERSENGVWRLGWMVRPDLLPESR